MTAVWTPADSRRAAIERWEAFLQTWRTALQQRSPSYCPGCRLAQALDLRLGRDYRIDPPGADVHIINRAQSKRMLLAAELAFKEALSENGKHHQGAGARKTKSRRQR